MNDDNDPITFAWLGLMSDNGSIEMTGPENSLYVYMGHRTGAVGHWCATINGAPFSCAVRLKNRGHLRKLCEVLEVGLSR